MFRVHFLLGCIVREIILVLILHSPPKNNGECLSRAEKNRNVFVFFLFSVYNYFLFISLVTPLVLQITEPNTKIFLLFGIQAIAAFTTCSFLVNNWKSYYITCMDCPMSKRPGVALSDSHPVCKNCNSVHSIEWLCGCMSLCLQNISFQLPLFWLYSELML